MNCGLLPKKARRQELHPGLPSWWQGPKHSGHLLLFSQAHQQVARLEVEQSGLEPVLRWSYCHSNEYSPLYHNAGSRFLQNLWCWVYNFPHDTFFFNWINWDLQKLAESRYHLCKNKTIRPKVPYIVCVCICVCMYAKSYWYWHKTVSFSGKICNKKWC